MKRHCSDLRDIPPICVDVSRVREPGQVAQVVSGSPLSVEWASQAVDHARAPGVAKLRRVALGVHSISRRLIMMIRVLLAVLTFPGSGSGVREPGRGLSLGALSRAAWASD